MTHGPVEIAISGCGAVTDLYYGPTLRRLAKQGLARVVSCFDPDPERRRMVGRSHPHAFGCEEFDALFHHGPQLVIIASPPRQHAPQVITALSRGSHVLCEKPLTLSVAEARSMVATAATARRRLLIGMVRRRLPAARLMRETIAKGVLGNPIGFDVFEGGPFDWPIRGTAYFDPRGGGVGVLADIGSHLLDLVAWWLGDPHEVESADDAMGGVEANALVSLRCGSTAGRLRLSRDWHRPNHATVKGTKGTARWNLEETDRIEVTLGDGKRSELRAAAGESWTFLECFEQQIRDVLAAVRGEPANVVDAAEVLPSVAAIETAYREGSMLPMPWLSASECAAAREMRST